MTKCLTSLFLAAAMTLTGCFTAAGGLIGHSVTSPEEVTQPDGTIKTTQRSHTETGLLIGAAIDLIAVVVYVAAVKSIPDEAIGRR